MKTRMLQTKMWSDDFFFSLSSDARLLFIFLLTNEKIGLTGAYELPDRLISFYTGIVKENLLKTKEQLKGKVAFDKSWVIILNHDKYNNYASNKKMSKAYTAERKALPKHIQAYMESDNDRVSDNVDRVSDRSNTVSDNVDTLLDRSDTPNINININNNKHNYNNNKENASKFAKKIVVARTSQKNIIKKLTPQQQTKQLDQQWEPIIGKERIKQLFVREAQKEARRNCIKEKRYDWLYNFIPQLKTINQTKYMTPSYSWLDLWNNLPKYQDKYAAEKNNKPTLMSGKDIH